MEVDDVDDCFFRGMFQFFVFFLPQTLILCLVFRKVFNLLFNYKISILFRRFYFTPCVLIQMLVETNLAFFTYLIFKQIGVAFSFQFTDKIFLALSILIFGIFLVFSLCSYFIGNQIYGKGFGYFIYCYYRCFPAMGYITIKYILRGFLKGAIHHFFHEEYMK